MRARRAATRTITPRQARILTLHGRGLNDKEIAEVLGLSLRTVRGHIQEAMVRLEAGTRAAAVVAAIRVGALTVDQIEGTTPEGGGIASRVVPDE